MTLIIRFLAVLLLCAFVAVPIVSADSFSNDELSDIMTDMGYEKVTADLNDHGVFFVSETSLPIAIYNDKGPIRLLSVILGPKPPYGKINEWNSRGTHYTASMFKGEVVIMRPLFRIGLTETDLRKAVEDFRFNAIMFTAFIYDLIE